MSNLKRFLSKAKAMSRSTLSVVLVLCLLMLMIPTVLLVAADAWDGSTVATAFAGGDGSEGNPFQISTGAELAYFSQYVTDGTATNGVYFVLTNDIDLGGHKFAPIGGTSKTFYGNFNGMDFEITGLNVDVTHRYSGLFGRVGGGNARISNLTVRGTVKSTGNSVGGITGQLAYGACMSNCAFIGDVTGDWRTGGLIGILDFDTAGLPQAQTMSVTGCYAEGTVKSTNSSNGKYTGGLVGCYANPVTPADGYGRTLVIEDCYSVMTVANGGGLLGPKTSTSAGIEEIVIKNAFFAGTVGGANGAPISNADVSLVAGTNFTNVFYKTNSISGEATGLLTGATACTADEFRGGTVLAQLNAGGGDKWAQGADYPIFRVVDKWDGTTVATAFAGGDGSEANPFLISTGAELAYFSQYVAGSSTRDVYFALANDINLDDHAFTPIGGTASFAGHFDGMGFEITGLKISVSQRYAGLFPKVSYGSVSNLTVRGYVKSTGNSVGGITGQLAYGACMSNCAFIGEVIGDWRTGGLVGILDFDTEGLPEAQTMSIIDCYTEGSVTSTSSSNGKYTGGLVGCYYNKVTTALGGYGRQLLIQDSYSAMTVSNGGGLLGMATNTGTLFTTDLVIKNAFFAGTMGVANGAPITNAVATDLTTCTFENVFYKAESITGEASGLLTDATAYTADKFIDGTVLALLNGTGSKWAQGTHYPVFSNITLYPELSNLQIDNGQLAFNADTTTYDVYLRNSVTSLAVKPTFPEGTTVTVNGTSTDSGVAVPVALTADNTTVITIVASRDGNEKVYTINAICGDFKWDGVSALPFPNIAEEKAGTAEKPFEIALPEHFAFLQMLANATPVKDTATGTSTATVEVGGTPYTVTYTTSSAGHLYGVYFKLVADIDLNNKPWEPFAFNGHLDGNNFTLSGLSVQKPTSNWVGLFTSVKYGSVSNLAVVGNVVGGVTVGGITGNLEGGASLTNCSFTGNVTGSTHVGGLVGRTVPYSGGAVFNVTACWTSGTITASGIRLGGLVGSVNYNADHGGQLILKDCYSDMTVTTTAASIDQTAGLIGNGDVIYRNCFFAGQINAAYPIGFSKSNTVGSVYYMDGSFNTTTGANAGFVGGTKKSADDFKSAAFVELLNTYAAQGVTWANGTDHPVLTYVAPTVVEPTTDPFFMTDLMVEHVTFTFSPSVFTYSFGIPYSADKIHVLPTVPEGATVTVNGQAVESEAISQAISLEVGVEKTVVVKMSVGDSYTDYELKLLRKAKPENGAWDGALEPFDATDKKGSSIDNPILINTPGQLAYLSAMANGTDVMLDGKLHKAPAAASGKVYSKTFFEITADLVMNDVSNYANWLTAAPANDLEPIGYHNDSASLSRNFAGTVNGNSHKIIGLYVNNTSYGGAAGVGLFGSVDSGTLRNIHIVDSYVTGSMRVGGLVGRPRTDILVQNCSFSGIVHGTLAADGFDSLVGGLVGDIVGKATFNSCWTEGTVIGGNSTGGFIGQLYMQSGCEIKNCYSTMTVQADDGYLVGGLIGRFSGQSGNLEVFRSHFAGHVPTNTPFIGVKTETAPVFVTESETFYYRADSYEGDVDSTLIYKAVEKSVEEFADDTVTDLLNDLVDYGDFWKWETSDKGYPVSDGVLLVTDYVDRTNDSVYDDGDWYSGFENKPGGTLEGSTGNEGGSGDAEDNSATGETSLFTAVVILALVSAASALLLVRRKRSAN